MHQLCSAVSKRDFWKVFSEGGRLQLAAGGAPCLWQAGKHRAEWASGKKMRLQSCSSHLSKGVRHLWAPCFPLPPVLGASWGNSQAVMPAVFQPGMRSGCNPCGCFVQLCQTAGNDRELLPGRKAGTPEACWEQPQRRTLVQTPPEETQRLRLVSLEENQST